MGDKALLLALGYPRAQTFNHADPQYIRNLVVWLENVKIRQYPVEERKELGDTQSSAWQDTFSKYLQDVDCPLSLEPGGSNTQAVLQWLLNYAVSLEYADAAEQYNATTQQLQQKQQAEQQQQQEGGSGRKGQHHKQQPPFADLHSPETKQALSDLFQLLHVDTSQGGLGEHLQAAKEVLRDSVLPSLTDASVQHALSSSTLDTHLLGFETGDAAVDRLGTVLRLLYIRDLRQLQTAIDRMVVEVQEYTANPRTDSSLGKVGR